MDRPCIEHHHIFHDWHPTTCTLCKEATAEFSWACPSSPWRRACQKICSLYTTTWQKETWTSTGTSTYLLPILHQTFVGVWWRWCVGWPDRHTCPRSMCMEKSCNRLLRSRRMMMMMRVTHMISTEVVKGHLGVGHWPLVKFLKNSHCIYVLWCTTMEVEHNDPRVEWHMRHWHVWVKGHLRVIYGYLPFGLSFWKMVSNVFSWDLETRILW